MNGRSIVNLKSEFDEHQLDGYQIVGSPSNGQILMYNSGTNTFGYVTISDNGLLGVNNLNGGYGLPLYKEIISDIIQLRTIRLSQDFSGSYDSNYVNINLGTVLNDIRTIYSGNDLLILPPLIQTEIIQTSDGSLELPGNITTLSPYISLPKIKTDQINNGNNLVNISFGININDIYPNTDNEFRLVNSKPNFEIKFGDYSSPGQRFLKFLSQANSLTYNPLNFENNGNIFFPELTQVSNDIYDLTINNSGKLSKKIIHTNSSLGNGETLISTNSQTSTTFKSIKASGVATISSTSDDITINVAASTDTNIYNSDGTLTSARNVNGVGGTNPLNFNGCFISFNGFYYNNPEQNNFANDCVLSVNKSNGNLASTYMTNSVYSAKLLLAELQNFGAYIIFYTCGYSITASYNIEFHYSNISPTCAANYVWDFVCNNALTNNTWYAVRPRIFETSGGNSLTLEVRRNINNLEFRLVKSNSIGNWTSGNLGTMYIRRLDNYGYALPYTLSNTVIPVGGALASNYNNQREIIYNFLGTGVIPNLVFNYQTGYRFSIEVHMVIDRSADNINYNVALTLNGFYLLQNIPVRNQGAQMSICHLTRTSYNDLTLNGIGALLNGTNSLAISYLAANGTSVNMPYSVSIILSL